MKNQSQHLRTAVATAVIATAGLSSFSAFAAPNERLDAAARAEIQQTYRAERAACTDGSSTQERSACLAEASAVRKEALAGVLGVQTLAANERAVPGEADLLANALSRCDAVPRDVRTDCERRTIGGDAVIVVGSVAEGAILRELAPAEPLLVVAQADITPAANEVATSGSTTAEVAPGMAADMSPELASDTASGTATEIVVAEPTEPPMEADPAQATRLTVEPPAEMSPAVGTDPLADMAVHPAIAPAGTTDAAVAVDAVEPVEAATTSEPLVEVQPVETLEAGPAQGADSVAYPEWMVQQRFN